MVLNDWDIRIGGIIGMVGWFLPVVARSVASATAVRWCWPRYHMFLGAADGDSIRKTLELIDEEKLEPVIDPRCPFPFTEEGVRDAFLLHERRAGHGKIVIRVSNEA